MKNKIIGISLTVIIAIAISFIVFAVRGLFTVHDAKNVMRILSDGFFISGILVGGFGLLIFASNGGVFRMLAYSAILFVSLFRKNVARKYKDFYEYSEAKKGKRRDFLYILVIGGVFILFAAIFVIIYYKL